MFTQLRPCHAGILRSEIVGDNGLGSWCNHLVLKNLEEPGHLRFVQLQIGRTVVWVNDVLEALQFERSFEPFTAANPVNIITELLEVIL